MNWPDSPGGGSSTPSRKKEIQLQGPRPPQLKVSHESHKIRKPPPHPRPQIFAAQQPRPPLPPSNQQRHEPVIIYAVSPKVIHVNETNFMSVVQSLTGLSSSSSAFSSGAGDLSPAARIASIERTSPTSERERVVIDVSDVMDTGEIPVEFGQAAPGILSPAPATLPTIPTGFFSPVTDPQTFSFLQDYSPYWQGNNFSSSPSALFPTSILSPLSSPNIFSNLFDF